MELRMLFFEWLVLLLGTASSHGGRRSRRDWGRAGIRLRAKEDGERDWTEAAEEGRSVRRSVGASDCSENRAMGRKARHAIMEYWSAL